METPNGKEQKQKRQPRSLGARNKAKGNNAERFYMNEFKKMGFDKCVTSRNGSTLADAAKIDLLFLPFNPQIKAGYRKGINPSGVLKEMEDAIAKTFPAHTLEFNNPNVMIHHKNVGTGMVRTPHHSIVSMTFETFQHFLKLAYLKNTKT